jgi:hypothetical protein
MAREIAVLSKSLCRSVIHHCSISGTLIYDYDGHSEVIEMSMVCQLLGHWFQDTYVIHPDGDFYEVDDAKYCRLCGTVHAPSIELTS